MADTPMGIDALDMAFRIERDFQMKWERSDFDRLFARTREREPKDVTAGDVHDYVCTRLIEMGRPVPHSSWHRIQKVLAETTATPPKRIRRQTYLKQDLGFYG